jgi:hypothetical protein
MTIASSKTANAPLFTLTNDSGIEIEESGTEAVITLTDTQTATITDPKVVFQIDVELLSGVVERRLIGTINIEKALNPAIIEP